MTCVGFARLFSTLEYPPDLLEFVDKSPVGEIASAVFGALVTKRILSNIHLPELNRGIEA